MPATKAAAAKESARHLLARWCWGVTAFCAAAGVVISVLTAAHSTTGHFRTPTQRAFNTFAFFTVQSNLLAGGTTLLLMIRRERSSFTFAVFRMIGLVAITVTGVVYHVALAGIFDLQGWDQLGNQLVHTAVPLLMVIGWVAFGPRGLTSRRIVYWSIAFPLCWLCFTLIRGAVVHWYPYPFIDVNVLGYGGAAVNCLWVALLLLGLAAGAHLLDAKLRPAALASA